MSNDDPPPDPSVPNLREKSPSKLDVVTNLFTGKKPSKSNVPPVEEAVAPELGIKTFAELFTELLDKEISVEFNTLTVGEYVVLVFMHLIQNQPSEARLAAVRGIERHGGPHLLCFVDLTTSIFNNDYSNALRLVHAVQLPESFAPYLTELKNRLLVRRLAQILTCYSTIKLEHLVDALGPQSNEFVEGLLLGAQWPVDEEKFVTVLGTDGFHAFLSCVIDPRFGPEPTTTRPVKAPPQNIASAADQLKALVKYADFLDRP